MKILIAGAAALVGRYFLSRAAQAHEVVALKRADLDITDGNSVHRCVREVRPNLVVNCAVIQVDDQGALASQWLLRSAAVRRATTTTRRTTMK